MRCLSTALAMGLLALLLSACGSNNITDDFFTPTPITTTASATATPLPTANGNQSAATAPSRP
jgi:hypothetical protein